MKTWFPALLIAATVLPSPARSAPTPKRIHFALGSICARIPGQIPPKQVDTYFVIGAKKGQHLTVNLAPGPRSMEFANSGTVRKPSGQEEGTKGGIVYDEDLTETGDYRIRVGRSLMATHGGRAAFVLEIVITINSQKER
jgi:hypothetical protein